jgi:uncharacterized coiled-coil protein SlyX
MKNTEDSKMLEYGLLFFAAIAIAYTYLNRDSGRWTMAINHGRENKTQIITLNRQIEAQNKTIADLSESVGRLRTVLMSYQSNFEEDFNDVSRRCEMVEASQKRISKNQTYLRGLAEATKSVEITFIERPPKLKKSEVTQ